jgi:tight adherence protein B
VGGFAVGVVGAAVVVAYSTAGLVVIRGAAVRRSHGQGLRLAADAVQCLAADLRAGVAMESALRAADTALRRAAATQLPGWRRKNAANEEKDGVLAVARRVDAAVTLAQASGAALADLLDRLDAHIRAGQRARAIAHAQAAGARASATILAAMPFAGIALGSAIGADPWHVLLHTVAGGIALCAAVALQIAGLGWTARLARIEVLP